jgi:hypothetical protein
MPTTTAPDDALRALLRALPPRKELAYRVALADESPSLWDEVAWSQRVSELCRTLRFNGRGARNRIRDTREFAEAVAEIEAQKATKKPRRR